MKKFLLIALTCVAFGAFAQELKNIMVKINRTMNLTAEEIAKVNASNNDRLKATVEFQQAALKNPKLFTDYALAKPIIEELAKKHNVDLSVLIFNDICYRVYVHKFTPQVIEAIYNDKSLNNDIKIKFLHRLYIAPSYKVKKWLPITEFANKVVLTNNNIVKYNLHEYKMIYKIINENQYGLDDKTLLDVYKKLRRSAYPKISQSEGWKKFIVDVELSIKAIQ